MNRSFKFGIETLIHHTSLEVRKRMEGKRIALLSHPGGVDSHGVPTIDRVQGLVDSIPGAKFSALFGPQHGLRGEKQDNMIESEDYLDPDTGLPTYSLYGTTRRLTPPMKDSFDFLLVDMQDVGVRVYTFLTTLGYLIEDLASAGDKEIVVLDRPNPTGRLIEGNILGADHTSFVGIDSIPMQHGLTLGEFALWYLDRHKLQTRVTVVPMEGWNSDDPRQAWPADVLWLQPSPNMPSLSTARCYPGTVVLEGTTLSEGRGTTRPLSQFGHPQVDWKNVLSWVHEFTGGAIGPGSYGALIRQIAFQPTFHKHAGVITPGLEWVAEGRFYDPQVFRPFRFIAVILKGIHSLYPEIPLWTKPPYEYEYEKTPIDVINGGPRYRLWVEDPQASWADFDQWLRKDEETWRSQIQPWLIYHGKGEQPS